MKLGAPSVALLLAACQTSSSSPDAPPSVSVPAPLISSAPLAVVAPSTSAAPSGSAPDASDASDAPPNAIIAQHVLVTYKGAKNAPRDVTRNRADARALAEKVRDEARAGTPFEDLVARYSEDPGSKDRLGSVGKITREKMVKPFSDAAFALRVNEVSDVVETPFGFHVIKRVQ